MKTKNETVTIELTRKEAKLLEDLGAGKTRIAVTLAGAQKQRELESAGAAVNERLLRKVQTAREGFTPLPVPGF